MQAEKIKLDVRSEIGQLQAVILHPPGAEVENMTPRMAQRALYSDILNLDIARKEYAQLHGVLSRCSRVLLMDELLVGVLDDMQARRSLLQRICVSEDASDYYGLLLDMDSATLAKTLIEGLPAQIDTLTAYLRNEYYALYPLYNFYFTRDASVTIGGNALICRMANRVRMRESYIMDAIFRHSPLLECNVFDANDLQPAYSPIKMEGGDIQVIRDNILLIGNGVRTSSQGIDFLIERFGKTHPEGTFHIIVQQLPETPESFIHLDMVFTMLDRDKCLVFEPLVLNDNSHQTVRIDIRDGKVSGICTVRDILSALKGLGIDLKPIICGGSDEWDQEREQWHSGANAFAFAPGKILVYARNVHTLESLGKAGFRILSADDVISGKASPEGDSPCAVTIAGSELPRGGGGARCMTMPVSRKSV